MAVNPRDRIIDMYRAEHRDLRDNLLALIEAFKTRDKRKIRPLIKAVDEGGGPHMRCEEEAIYPALDKYYMDNQLEHLLTEHDLIIATLRKLYQLIERGPISDDDVRVAELHIRCVLTHVTDCDGALLLVELLSERKAKSILTARRRADRESLSICQYASEARGRMLRASSLRVLFGGC
jgi:DNA-binding PadR family transcriptional regulator